MSIRQEGDEHQTGRRRALDRKQEGNKYQTGSIQQSGESDSRKVTNIRQEVYKYVSDRKYKTIGRITVGAQEKVEG